MEQLDMLTNTPNLLELCRKKPETLTPGELMELRRQLQGLTDWWLHSEVLKRMQVLLGRGPRPPRVPTAPGSCWVLFAQRPQRPFAAVRSAFVLPLVWRPNTPDSSRLPKRLRELARAIARAAYQPSYGLHLDPSLGDVELVRADSEFQEVRSCGASLAGGLLVSVKGGTVDPHIWASGGWDPDKGIVRVGHLREKMLAALELGAKEFFVPDLQFEEAQGIDLGGKSLHLGKLRTGTLDLHRALGQYLHRLDAPPPEPRDADDQDGFNRCADYYLRYPHERADFYRQFLLPIIVERCARQLRRDYPSWQARALITIVSGRPELSAITACATGVHSCLLLYTRSGDTEQDQTQAKDEAINLIRRLKPNSVAPRCRDAAFTYGPEMHGQIPEAICRFCQEEAIDPHQLVLDITPGTKWMNWVCDHAMPEGSWRLYVRNDALRSPGAPRPGTEKLIVWKA
ncbi:MAG: hypothetical protein NZ700_00985 [Gemmataceae bacterium]|nr:hypothetical protein [Gemmataceae bacterium]MDW8265791.1 hypothetical protein [Gemmataceae bacterium]